MFYNKFIKQKNKPPTPFFLLYKISKIVTYFNYKFSYNNNLFTSCLKDNRGKGCGGKKLPINSGFMLVEMIISVAIFSIVMTIGVGSLLSIIDANRRAHSFKIVVNNVNLAMEGISKELRVGYNYNCGFVSGGDCSNGDDIIYLKSKFNQDIIYRLDSNTIEKSVDGGGFIGITSSDISIDNLKFYVLGSSPSDFIQPRVVIVIQGNSNGTDFDLQTTVSQRSLDSS